MVAADLKREEDRDRGIIKVPIAGMAEPLRLLRAVALYGANASGKSTVLAASQALRWLASGTQKLFNIASDWWTLANKPVMLLVDELSASLHPRLLDRLVRAVNDAPTTRVRSQLILTTHDTGLLESQDGQPPALSRDQVYFTKKDDKGASELYSLAEFKEDARPVHNIRNRYLSGLYGAIPSVEKLSL